MADKPSFNRTDSTFSRNPETLREFEVRRDNDIIRTPKVQIVDVDYAILDYIRSVIRPRIIENNREIEVPVMFANGETWAQIQSKGFMYDLKGKIMTPVISLRRTDMSARTDFISLGVNRDVSGFELVHKNSFTVANRYDRFSVLQNTKPREEYYVSPIPEYYEISYEMLMWTEYTEQMNNIIEQIMPTAGFAYGTTFKFSTLFTEFSFETVNATGEDRLVRSSTTLRVKANMLSEFELYRSNLEKRLSVKTIRFKNETTSDNSDVDNAPPGGF